jgi:hypothetical protein
LGVPNNYYHYVSNGYEFIFRINFVFDWNGKTYNDSNDYSIEVNDYLAGDFTNESIKSYDEDGVEILDLGVKFLKGVSKIVASFERIGIPNEKDLQAYFMIEKFEGTGLSDARKTTTARSSIYETIKAIDIEVQPNLILVTGFVDENLLSAGNYTIYCRLFEKVIEVPIGGFVGLGEEPNFLIIDENNNAIII